MFVSPFLRMKLRTRSALIVLMAVMLIGSCLWQYGDFAYGDRYEEPALVVPTTKPTNQSWDESLAAEGSKEGTGADVARSRVEEAWRGQRIQHEMDEKTKCQGLLVEQEKAVEQGRERERMEKRRWDKSTALKGPPKKMFRDNLRNDTYYMTSWSSSGFTNEFIIYVNMIYLATLTDRVPIIPPFAPDHHISASAGNVPFGDVFDLDYLSTHLRTPVLEWRDVKIIPTSSDADAYPYAKKAPHTPEYDLEPLGCWSTRVTTELEPIRSEHVVNHIGVDVSYTRVPSFTRRNPNDPNEFHVVLPQLAALLYRSQSFSSSALSPLSPSWVPYADPEAQPERYEDLQPAPSGHHNKPEAHLACFDSLYYATSGAEVYEWRFGFSPVWRSVGRWLRFSKKMKSQTRAYLEVLFGKDEVREKRTEAGDDMDVPPFIAVHVRRGDFARKCGQEACYPPLALYRKNVEDVKKELSERKGIEVKHVVLMSDESSVGFWDEVRSIGWLSIDHTAHRTLERFGEWYPPIIDVAVQGYAVGFVGTEDSTFSMVSQKRVIDWNGGVVRSVNANAVAGA